MQPELKAQRGAVLAVSLILLLVITLVVISGGREVLMQEKMLESHRDGHLSLAAAEAGLREAEDIIAAGISEADWGIKSGYYSKGSGPLDPFMVVVDDGNSVWQGGNYFEASVNYAGGDNNGQNAQIYIEQLGPYGLGDGNGIDGGEDMSMRSYDFSTDDDAADAAGTKSVVKVVSRALGRSGNSERILVAYFTIIN